MAPHLTHSGEVRKAGRRRQAKNRVAVPPWLFAFSVLLLLDVLDHLGHVIFILAEFRGILEKFFVFLFGFFERNSFLFLLRDIGLVGLELGIELLPSNRLELLRNRRDGAGAPRFQ